MSDLMTTLRPLLDALADDRITDEQMAELDRLLQGNHEARRLYIEFVGLTTDLERQLAPEAARVAEPGALVLRRPQFYLAAAASLLVAVFLGAFFFRSVPQKVAVQENSPPAAVLTRTVKAEWLPHADRPEVGCDVQGKWLRLSAGLLQVAFRGGAHLVLEGPAALRVDSEAGCFVEYGKLTVLAPGEGEGFTVDAPKGRIVDLGTEFGVEVDESGKITVHVIDGKVEVSLAEKGQTLGGIQTLRSQRAAVLDPQTRRIDEAPFDAERFESIRYAVLRQSLPLHLQFDCGFRAGLYEGTESPAHANRDLYPHERYWNRVLGDQAGPCLMADGTLTAFPLVVDCGHAESTEPFVRTINWNAPPEEHNAVQGPSLGVLATPLAEDGIHHHRLVGLRLKGLPAGRYRVYVMARETARWNHRQNTLLTKQHLATVGVNIDALGDAPQVLAPLTDPEVRAWVEGETHVVAEVDIATPEDWLCIITDRDHRNSQRGGRGILTGFQIVQIE